MGQFEQHFFESNLEVKDEWQTPDWIFRRLTRIWDFTVDAAAGPENKKVRYYWSIYDDGLSKLWGGHRVFVNPPFTKGKYALWTQKAADEYLLGGCEIVMVLPFKPETKGWKKIWAVARYLIIPYKRIKYYPPKGVVLAQSSPTFMSAIAAFTEKELNRDEIVTLSQIGRVLDLKKGYLRP